MLIRPAVISDAASILGFITDLAIYEKEPNAVHNTVAAIESTLFANNPKAQALICEHEGQAIGFAVYFFNYSTWLGQHGIYLEDLYVAPEQRGLGAGKALMKHLAKLALENNCGRFEWCVLNWNQSAIDMYDSIGAKPQSEWTSYRLDGEALAIFAQPND